MFAQKGSRQSMFSTQLGGSTEQPLDPTQGFNIRPYPACMQLAKERNF